MVLRELKKILNSITDDDLEVIVRDSLNIYWAIGSLDYVRKPAHIVGVRQPCVIINPKFARGVLERADTGHTTCVNVTVNTDISSMIEINVLKEDSPRL